VTVHTTGIKGPPSAPLPGRSVTHEWQHNGRHLTAGTEFSVRGERGRFRFVAHVRTDAGAEWIDAYGGPEGYEQCRSFRPERVTTIHHTTKTRTP
jgi:hypothetical protein